MIDSFFFSRFEIQTGSRVSGCLCSTERPDRLTCVVGVASFFCHSHQPQVKAFFVVFECILPSIHSHTHTHIYIKTPRAMFPRFIITLLTCLGLYLASSGSQVSAFTPRPFLPRSTAASSTTAQQEPSSISDPKRLQHFPSTILFGKKAARAEGNERKNKTERVKKPKDDVIEVEAVVIESLPNAMFRCQIDGASENQEPVLATISGKIRKNFVKILVGDKVLIELSPYDLTRGRITFRYR